MVRVVHVITGLEIGGAEMALYKLLAHTPGAKDSSKVVSLMTAGPVADMIRSLGVQVESIGLGRGAMSLKAIRRCSRIIRDYEPDIVQTWLYHSNLIGGYAARRAGVKRVAWGIRSSLSAWNETKPLTQLVIKLGARVSSKIPQKIVCVSHSAAQQHIEIGFDGNRFQVIPNGFDLDMFRPDPEARLRFRAELGVPEDTVLLGSVGRFHPHKDYATLIEAFGKLENPASEGFHAKTQRAQRAKLVLVGKGLDSGNAELASLIESAKVGDRFRLLGPRTDIPKILPALDLFVLSSSSEGFPNVVGESMACGVPCVATNVGDTSYVVGDTGRCVPSRNPSLLAGAIDEMLALPKSALEARGVAARERIREHFGIESVARQYAEMYEGML